jgi:hypothetical protein
VKKDKNMRQLLIVMIVSYGINAMAEDKDDSLKITATWTTECEWNIRNGKANWANHLSVGMEKALWKGGECQIALLSATNMRLQKQKSWNVADDIQVFSNILVDEEVALAVAHAGINQKISDNVSVFVGVRNMNIDYFVSPYTTLFTNSSDGILPTIADNFSVANYPDASMGIHAEWNISSSMTLKNSLYNGAASHEWDGVFNVRPAQDGFINITEVSLKGDKGSMAGEYHAGMVYGNSINEEEKRKKKNVSAFAIVEQPIYKGEKEVGLLLQGGYTIKKRSTTYAYFGTGIVGQRIFRNDDAIGVQLHRALYSNGVHETHVELTYSMPINRHVTIHPAFHCVRTSGKSNVVALLRCSLSL